MFHFSCVCFISFDIVGKKSSGVFGMLDMFGRLSASLAIWSTFSFKGMPVCDGIHRSIGGCGILFEF